MKPNNDIIALDIALPDTDDLADDLRKYVNICHDKLGMIPNVLLAYSHNEGQLRTFSRFYNELMFGESGLSELEREMIAVAVSAVNHCFYCLTAHGAAIREYSKNPALGEQIVMNFRAADLSKRQHGMLEFAEKVTRESYAIDEADRAGLRNLGFGESEIWDIANIAAFFNMTNRVASAVDMRPNPEYHGLHRTESE